MHWKEAGLLSQVEAQLWWFQHLPLDCLRVSVVEDQSVELVAAEFAEVGKERVRVVEGHRRAESLDWRAQGLGCLMLSLEVGLNLAAAVEAMAFHWVVVERGHVDLEQRKEAADLVEAYHSVENKVYCFAS